MTLTANLAQHFLSRPGNRYSFQLQRKFSGGCGRGDRCDDIRWLEILGSDMAWVITPNNRLYRK